MDPEVRRLIDHRAISDVLARYARGIDRLDLELVASCYHPGATDDHGTFKGTVEEFIPWVEGQLTRFASTMHFLGNSLIEIQGDRAVAETYCIAHHRLADRDADSIAGLRYVDRFERRSDEWRISERTVVVEWNRLDDVNALGFHPDYVRAQRDRTDLVYRTTLA